MQDGLVVVAAIKPGGPCDGVGISIGDAIRFVDDYEVMLPPFSKKKNHRFKM